MKKRWVGGAAIWILLAVLAGCKAKGTGAAGGDPSFAVQSGRETAGAEAEESMAGKDVSSAQEAGGKMPVPESLSEAIAEQPVLLTSVGQSADYEIIKTMLDKIEISSVKDSLASPDDLGDAKTLILAVGGSSKGLGAAGIDANGELKRVEELTKAAREKGLTILAVHIGGEARRGDLSDQFIGPSFERADYAIVVADGDKDGLMAGLAVRNGIPMDTVNSMAEVVPKLEAAFKEE